MTITIPPAALEAASRAIYEHWRGQDSTDTLPPWEAQRFAPFQSGWHGQARAAVLALLEAWPRALQQQYYELTADGKRVTFPVLVLPLTTENENG